MPDDADERADPTPRATAPADPLVLGLRPKGDRVILVTGGLGFIGSHTVEDLVARSADCLAPPKGT